MIDLIEIVCLRWLKLTIGIVLNGFRQWCIVLGTDQYREPQICHRGVWLSVYARLRQVYSDIEKSVFVHVLFLVMAPSLGEENF